MFDIGAEVFAEWGVVPEDVVPLSVFSFENCQTYLENNFL